MDNKSEVANLDDVTLSKESVSEENSESTPVVKKEIKKPINKNEQAKELMKSSIEIISEADKEVESRKKTISKNVDKLEESKNSFINTTFTQSQILLEKASYEYSKNEPKEPFEISLDTANENIKVKNISSGGFTGFILALIAMIATVGGWIYLASTKVGVALQLEPPTIPDNASIEKMLTWIGGGMTGGEGNVMFGMATVGVSALIIGFLVYRVRVSLRENRNFKIANEIYEKSHIYVDAQKKSKTEMEKIDNHVKGMIPMLENYKYLLDEQNAKLQRVLHVEGLKEDYNDYHSSSIEAMRDSEKLMKRAEELISTPVTRDGKLNEESLYSLYEAKEVYDAFISRIYK
jgi:hypothetical protein